MVLLVEWVSPEYRAILPSSPDDARPQSHKRSLSTSTDSSHASDNSDQAKKRMKVTSTPLVPKSTSEQLLNCHARTSDILRDIEATYPQLSPYKSNSDEMQRFIASINAARFDEPSYPMYSDDNLVPSTNDEVDEFWAAAVSNEPRLTEGTYHKGLDMDPRLLVKPWDSFNSVIVSLTCYPTPRTTLRPHNSSNYDLFNTSIATVLN
ncbi:hypothetical protein FB567DRAFT_243452 [Paraphoma chrysanthemicola]|uniref:Uncharacterized protein n=1 Tax=Paraphoma chrysanthemicola TaxID=798071 RepID=A0A8K0QU01_9PLEO|nr:hypothetical protein FB567DRAFT_243452 [Paraphoma chrysanthemicola]